MVLKTMNIDLPYAAQLIPDRASDAYKNQFGHILIIAGNREMGGAGQMAALAAVHAGAGLTTIATDPINIAAIHSVLPEVMICDWMDEGKLIQAIMKANIILIGPGMGLENPVQWHILKQTLSEVDQQKTVVIDGDALTYLSQEIIADSPFIQFMKNTVHDFVLTPHRGEWARLTVKKINPDDDVAVQNWGNHYGVYLVLKGAPTRIFQPGSDTVKVNIQGNPGMSIGGMGDTLAGMVAGLLGQIKEIAKGLELAVFLHTFIADDIYANEYIVIPSDISKLIPATMKNLQRNRGNNH
ncbi:NAD(P)H-hydrate dehydratase [Aerococcus agrisoli]|uniref:ADP-dependent (S)-NAD(P)H-hydrate dehydratase n=1 Tax=Aerococcus agrisoli TaxID=2487350 RepID=A0A3N4GJT2_9LACT|nr:NAD(P)H-hydrate dehydratase [Aerococcus agrisoli]RPA62435.1 NAD(P)H-hydrate dehydratase [Aerococcus agrisoli]